MRRYLLLLATSIIVLVAPAQSIDHHGFVSQRISAKRAAGVRFNAVQLFTNMERSTQTDALWERALTKANVLRMDHNATVALLASRPAFIALELPTGTGTITVDLERIDITSDDFSLVIASTGSPTDYLPGAHYQGMVRGVPGSMAAISVFENEVMGIVSDSHGDRVLGRLEGDTQGNHVFYREEDLRTTSGAVCGTMDEPQPNYSKGPQDQGAPKTVKCVRFYWEVNYDIFQGKGSVVNATNYVTGLFNQSSILYANDGISVVLSQVFVWDVPSPYTQTSTSALLDQFGVTRTSFNGDLAHLLGYAGGGGIAWLNTLCNSQTRLRMAYSGINSTFQNVPTFNWSVEVVTHEQGHNMGSSHTHACVWNGNNTAIDGCGPTANAAYAEGTCATGPIPSSSVGGTIMSYCHLISAGINFANGFGPQPAALIVSRINSSSCLNNCSVNCGNPSALTAGTITNTSAVLSWAAVSGATSYSLQWKPSSGSTWTPVTGIATNSYALSGLSAATSYDYQVFATCPSGNSVYSSFYTFATTGGCADALEPNNSTGAPANIILPVTMTALIASTSDVDYYRFTLAATSNITINLSTLPGDYDLRLLNSGGTQLAISENGGTTSESISYPNAAAGTYFIHVFGYNQAFSLIQCYALNATATPVQTCGVPTNLAAGSITYSSASLSWTAVSGAVTYTLGWKPTSGSTWTTVTGISGTTYALTGLAGSTAYQFQVLTVCSASSSAYATAVSFTTLAVPCDVQPPIRVAVKMLLEGPYKGTPFAMSDSLRVKGQVPQQEPYTALGYTMSGTSSTTAPVLAVTGTNAVVDWVLVELRNATTPSIIVEARAGLLQRDGDVVAVDGTSALGFCSTAGSYKIAVRHRNHLGAMTAGSVALSSSAATVDMSVVGTSTYGTNARKNIIAAYMLWAGNTNSDNQLLYTGQDNDRDPILQSVGGTVPTNTVSGYFITDVNLDGRVRYIGQDNDRDPILSNLGGSVPTNSLVEQLP
ncbi:MAG: M12 family metallo-peptidase [Flavobacteriales bacterium]